MKKMKIGIGVISYGRPKHLELWKEQMAKYTIHPFDVSIYIDEPRKGIAFGKNQNLKELKHCDYIFLFDSDCFPISEMWCHFFIDAYKASGQNHFLFLKETSTIKKIKQYDVSDRVDISDGRKKEFPFLINSFNNCGGCFMFLTKEVIEKVGAFGEYGLYGMEHAGYSERIHQAELTTLGKYLCPEDVSKYIYSLDYDNYINFDIEHKPSIINEISKLNDYIEEGKKCFLKDIQQTYKPL